MIIRLNVFFEQIKRNKIIVVSKKNRNGNITLGARDLELADLIRFIFKWKYIILSCTFIFAIGSGFVAFKKPTMYKISTVIKVISFSSSLKLGSNESINSGMQSKNENAISILPSFPLESPENIQAIIQMGLLDKKIKQYIKDNNNMIINDYIDLDVKLLGENNIVKITYITRQPKEAVKILDSLKYVLLNQYKDRIKFYRDQNNKKIMNEIIAKENIIKMLTFDIDNISKRILELKNEIDILDKNTDLLNSKVIKFSKGNDNNFQAIISCNQTIQKNIELVNKYRSEYINLRTTLEQNKVKLQELNNVISTLYNELGIEKNIDNENKYIQILEPPENMVRPVKSKVKISVFLGGIFGFSLAVLIAYVSQYISIAMKKDNT